MSKKAENSTGRLFRVVRYKDRPQDLKKFKINFVDSQNLKFLHVDLRRIYIPEEITGVTRTIECNWLKYYPVCNISNK